MKLARYAGGRNRRPYSSELNWTQESWQSSGTKSFVMLTKSFCLSKILVSHTEYCVDLLKSPVVVLEEMTGQFDEYEKRGIQRVGHSNYKAATRREIGHMTMEPVLKLCLIPENASVLGQRMFIMYMADLADFNVGERQNECPLVDDTRTYLHCLAGDVDSVVCQLQECIFYRNWLLDVCKSS